MATRGEKWAQRILQELHHIGRRRRGSITHAERVVEKSSGYLRRRRVAGTMELSKCLAFMDALGVHPARFFRQVFPFTGDEVSCYLDPPEGSPPPIIARAWKRLSDSRPASIPRTHLVELDALRYTAPAQAAQGAREALPFIAPADVSFALGVWASAQRLLLDMDHATHALKAGMDIARSHRDEGSFGDLLQRLASVVGDHGNYLGSLFLAKEATDRHVLAGDMVSVGRTFVDRGIWLYYLERYEDAIAMHTRALSMLPRDEQRHRFSALQVSGLCHQMRGELARAQEYSQEALAEAEGLGPLLRGKQTWLQASICFDRGTLDEAEVLLKEVVTLFSTTHAGEQALATIDLAEVQLEAGKPGDAYLSTQTILPLITPLGAQNRIVQATERTLRDLASHGVAGMTKQMLVHLRDTVELVRRERHLWRSLLQE